jgi:hypothetical protein
MSFILYLNNQEHGPYTIDDLREAVKQGSVSADTMVRETNSSDWLEVSKLLESQFISESLQHTTNQKNAPKISLPPNNSSKEAGEDSVCVRISYHQTPFAVKFLNLAAWIIAGITFLAMFSIENSRFMVLLSSAISLRLISIFLNYFDEAVFRLRNIERYSAISALKKTNN